jgi:hypothetical protein
MTREKEERKKCGKEKRKREREKRGLRKGNNT